MLYIIITYIVLYKYRIITNKNSMIKLVNNDSYKIHFIILY